MTNKGTEILFDGHVVKVGLIEKKAKLERICKLEYGEIFMIR